MAQTTDWLSVLQGNRIVINQKRGKRTRRRRYSRGLMYMMGSMEDRVLGGLARGGRDYRRRSNRSARARRDGAMRDFMRNMSRSQEQSTQQASKLPRDMANSSMVKRMRRNVRRLARNISW